MSTKPDMGSIIHIKNQWNILVIGNYYVNYQNYQNLMLLSSSDTWRTLIHLLLFTNSAQRELVSICTQSIHNRNWLSLPYILGSTGLTLNLLKQAVQYTSTQYKANRVSTPNEQSYSSEIEVKRYRKEKYCFKVLLSHTRLREINTGEATRLQSSARNQYWRSYEVTK